MGKKSDVKIIINEGAPDWMLTFGDCMSLLLCFFVMLLTFSTTNAAKLASLAGGLQGAFGIIPEAVIMTDTFAYTKESLDVKENEERGNVTEGAASSSKTSNSAPMDLTSAEVRNRYDRFQQRLRDLGFANNISETKLDEGIVVSMPIDDLFYPDTTQIKEDKYIFLEDYANLVTSVNDRTEIANEIRIIPALKLRPESRRYLFDQQWELQTARARKLAEYLIRNYDILPERFGFSVKILPQDAPVDQIQLMLVERLGRNRLDFDTLLRDYSKEMERRD